ncbi:hypothetical protein R5R35_012994 [Gryllus longicercus]|uniref:Transmembrane protein 169 n=1 Tax=Gryllus longicercus TaxID=2509291 RepID=A0AAN9YZ30_9ORTH
MEVAEQPCFVHPQKLFSNTKSESLTNHIQNEQEIGKSPSEESTHSPLDICKDGGSALENGEIISKRLCIMNGSDKISVSPVVENGHADAANEALIVRTHPLEPISSTTDSLSQSEQSIDFDLIKETGSTKKSKAKKRVNICTDRETLEEDGLHNVETIALRRGSETSDSVAMSSSTDGCLTMTGTIKRGKKAGQSVDVRLNMSREELEVLEAAIAAKKGNSSTTVSQFICGPQKGPHIIVLTTLFFPFAVIISSIYSFYVGTITWYNIFTYYTEEKPVFCRIIVSPFLILLYPFVILILTIGLGLYAGLVQISWFFESWYKEMTDLEKGFYGWLCAALKHEDCSPYEVVVLTEIQGPGDAGRTVRSSSEDSTT